MAIPEPATVPATEGISTRYRDLDAWTPAEMLQAMWEGQLAAIAAGQTALPAIAAAVAAAVPWLSRGGRLVYVGAGTSGRIGVQDGAELPPTFNWPAERLVLLMAGGDAAFTRSIEGAEDDAADGRAQIAAYMIGADDVVIGIAASGSTPFTTAAIEEAGARGAMTVGIANSAGGTLLAASTHPILIETGAEVIAGSTRMKAGTAQKMALNLFSSVLMVQLGRVHQGLMVDMQARNEKLRHRAVRMLRHLTGADDVAIGAALAETHGRVKPAVLVLQGLDVSAADALLDRSAGRLRVALTRLKPA